jgi:shikimate kinase
MIRLIGPGGAGKSTVGACLAAQLQWPFLDLDRVFERRCTDIDAFIAAHGYAAYARANVETYLAIPLDRPGSVLALSSGFMVYPAAAHPRYPAVREAIVCDPATFVLLPSLDRNACVTETVRRQVARSVSRRDAVRERAVIEERFDLYVPLPATKVETMRPAAEVAAAILGLLAAAEPECCRTATPARVRAPVI